MAELAKKEVAKKMDAIAVIIVFIVNRLPLSVLIIIWPITPTAAWKSIAVISFDFVIRA
jgi:hypothetical protein